jgi:alkylation response protein AidB-like acyl-CoA dehydrogenase
VALAQDMEALRLEAVAHYGMPHAGRISLNGGNEPWVGPDHAEVAAGRYLNGRAASIYGGSREVQKNIVAKTVLGL